MPAVSYAAASAAIAAASISATRFAAFAAALSAGVRVFLAAFFRGGVLSRLLSMNSSTMRLRRSYYLLDRAAKSSANAAVGFSGFAHWSASKACSAVSAWAPALPRSAVIACSMDRAWRNAFILMAFPFFSVGLGFPAFLESYFGEDFAAFTSRSNSAASCWP